MAHRVKKFQREARARARPTPKSHGGRNRSAGSKHPSNRVAPLLAVAIAIMALAGVALSLNRGPPAVPEGSAPGAVAAVPPGYSVHNGLPHPERGNPGATVTVEAFEDYLCPFCKRFFDHTEPALLAQYGDRVRFVWHEFPNEQTHPFATKAAEAARCAGDQGRYWEMHDALYSKQGEWGYKPDSPGHFQQYASDLGLDTPRFNQCLDSDKHRRTVLEDYRDSQRRGVSGTPTFLVNGRKLVGAQSLQAFAQAIDAALHNAGVTAGGTSGGHL
ncbi:MAG: DsbA family protein [Euryarchaeota archaeon]|nr:DsbA family protein [Euryarchaeota archaeon]